MYRLIKIQFFFQKSHLFASTRPQAPFIFFHLSLSPSNNTTNELAFYTYLYIEEEKFCRFDKCL